MDEQPPENDVATKRIKNLKASVLKEEEDLVINDDGPIMIDWRWLIFLRSWGDLLESGVWVMRRNNLI